MTAPHNPQPPDQHRGFGVPAWSARLLELGRRNGDIPIYGSDEWHNLPPTDPRRFAAVVRAAECWRQDSTTDAIANRILAELADNDLLCRARLRLISHDLAAAQDWDAASRRPHHHQLQARRQGVT